MGSYWLGLLTIPAVVGAGALLYLAGRLANKALAALINRFPSGRPRQRAQVAAVVACARRAWWLNLPADVVLVVLAGHDMGRVEEIHDAVYRVIGPVATVRRKQKPEEASRG